MAPLPAYSNTFIIDDFSAQDVVAICDFSLQGPTIMFPNLPTQQESVEALKIVDGTVIGGWRICGLNLNVPNPPSVAQIQVIGSPDDGPAGTTPELFRYTEGTGVTATAMLRYNGTDGDMGTDTTPMSLNLLSSSHLRITYSKADVQVGGTATLTDSDGDSASLPFTLVGGTSTPTTILISLTDFQANNPALSLGSIQEVKLSIVSASGVTDYDLDLIDIIMTSSSCSNIDHWDKVSFISPKFLRDFGETPVSRINPGEEGEFKFLQIDPSNVLNLNQLVAEHLTSEGWTRADMTPIKQTDIQIVDIEYSNYCVQNPI